MVKTIAISVFFVSLVFFSFLNNGNNLQKGNFKDLNNQKEEKVEKKKEENKKIEDQEKENETKTKGKLYSVIRVFDGDTIQIYYNGKKTSVRILGINTPEVNNPYRKQECFGKEASKKAKEILTHKKVYIETDSSQSKFDKHGRLLAYVYTEDGKDFGKEMIKTGYAYEYTYHGHKYKHQAEYKKAEKFAREHKLGLWSEKTCNGKK